MSDCEHVLAHDKANDSAVCLRCGTRWFRLPFDELPVETDWPLPKWSNDSNPLPR